ncbi:V-type ATP synthase subunit B [Levyella massiliensis]|uniref:V-type ATP synthase subunit B n=1 Tax=Levyella massiliensis TaxID=938289 RepID=UPI00036A37A1|nr:V-type ATP synthase subunit B [Levyella massiliensis]
MKIEYIKLKHLESAIVTVDKVRDVGYGEIVTITSEGKTYTGEVMAIEDDLAMVQVFGDTTGMTVDNAVVTFEGRPLSLPLNASILGRVFDGLGNPIDGGGAVFSDKRYNINGSAMNPVAREYPKNFIQTGISAIDGLMTIIRGQKLPIFSGSGLDHDRIAAQIIRQSQIRNTDDDFCFVFGAIGVQKDEADFFEETFRAAGVQDKVASYINLADDPVMERLITPKCALTAAEYLAFEEHKHVLVLLTDITSYAEALREISNLREEVPSRKGFPGYLYSDLAAMYERAGILRSGEGSITLIPILSMPNDDITHPIPDLTGYITEGQIVLSRELSRRGIYPAIDILPSLSRLMKDGIGEGFTREDHADVMRQIYASYAKAQEVRNLAQIIGEDDLSDDDRKILSFGDAFEEQFLRQDFTENRSIEQTLDLGWSLFKLLPESELSQISPEMKEKYLKR